MANRFSVDTVFTGIDHMSGPMMGMRAKASALSAALDSTSKFGDRIGAGFRSAIATGAVVGAVGGGIAAKVIDIGMGFEQTMSGVAAVSGATDAEFSRLKAGALELGAATGRSGTEVAGAFEIMAKAGMGVNDILSATPGLLSAAAADGAGIEETAGNIMGAMKAMGLGPEKMQLFADQMAKAGDSTAASIGTISHSLAIAGPVFKQLNVPMSSAIAQIAILQDAGVDASSSGTQLASTYSKLAAPMGETKKAIAALGLEITDSFGNMKAPEKLFDEILDATDKVNGNAGKMAAFTHLVGLESQKALLNVASAARDGRLGALTTDLNKAAGYSDSLAKKRLNNLAGDLKLLTAGAEGFATKLYMLESGPLRGVVQGANDWLKANSGIIATELGNKIAAWIPVVANFGDGLKDAFTDAVPVAQGLASALGVAFGDGESSPRIQAYLLGEQVGDLAVTLGTVWLATKAVSAATFVYGAITKGAAAAVWLHQGAVVAGRWATVAYETSIKTARATTLAFALAADAGVISGNAWSLSMIRMRLAALTAAGGMQALAVTAGAALAAVGAVMVAVDQNDKLKQQTGGKGILDVTGDVLPTWMGGGGMTFKQSADENLDKQAKRDAAERQKKEKSRFQFGSSDADVAALFGQNQLMDVTGLGAINVGAMPQAMGAPPPGLTGPVVPTSPQVATGRDGDAGRTAATQQELQKAIRDLPAQVRDSLKGTVTIKLPPGISGQVSSSASGIEVNQSGGF